MKSNIIAILLFIALAPRFAVATTAELPDQTQSGTVELDSEEIVFRQLQELSRQAKLSLSEAIVLAENLHNGSRAVQIGFERAGALEYRVRTVRDSVIWENTIDARNGLITGKETRFSFSELNSDDRRDLDALKHVMPELLEAVGFAEKAVEGKAVGAILIDESGTPNFAVVVIHDDQLKQVMLEARTDGRHPPASHRRVRN